MDLTSLHSRHEYGLLSRAQSLSLSFCDGKVKNNIHANDIVAEQTADQSVSIACGTRWYFSLDRRGCHSEAEWVWVSVVLLLLQENSIGKHKKRHRSRNENKTNTSQVN